MSSEIKVDTISENTSANGVAIDSVTLKDGGVTYSGGGSTSSLLAETWRYTASASLSGGDNQTIATNLERADDTATGHLNQGMTQSSGIFTFPATGFYWVNFHAYYYSNNQGATTYIGTKIMTTVDNTTYVASAQGYQNYQTPVSYTHLTLPTIYSV